MDVAFDGSGVGSQSAALGDALLASHRHHPLMNLFGDRRTQQSKGAAEGREVRRNLGIEVGEAAVHQVAAEFAFLPHLIGNQFQLLGCLY